MSISRSPLLRDVNFTHGVDPGEIAFDPELGFLRDKSSAESLRVVGFSNGVLLSPDGGDGQTSRAITCYDDVPEAYRNIDAVLGKGIGPRFYVSREGVDMCLAQPGSRLGVYVLDLSGVNMHDMRGELPGSFGQVLRHARILAGAALRGTREEARAVDDAYGDAGVIIRPQPPAARIKQALRGQRNPQGISQAFMLVRDPRLPIRQIGQIAA